MGGDSKGDGLVPSVKAEAHQRVSKSPICAYSKGTPTSKRLEANNKDTRQMKQKRSQ